MTGGGLLAFHGLVVGLGDKIDLSLMGNYVKHALQSMDNDCCGLACGLVSDLSGSMMERMNEYLDDFVPCLHTILNS